MTKRRATEKNARLSFTLRTKANMYRDLAYSATTREMRELHLSQASDFDRMADEAAKAKAPSANPPVG